MLRSELVAKLQAEYPDIRTQDVEEMVEIVFDEIIRALEKGDRVELRGFGAFSVRRRSARQGRNPRTGEVQHIPAKKSAKISAGSTLKAIANGDKPAPS